MYESRKRRGVRRRGDTLDALWRRSPDNIQQVRARIAQACDGARRPVQSVTLLCVSKTFGPDAVRDAHAAGERCFGENYVQEALDKIAALADLRAPSSGT